jgi:small subunit ribosomal protein S5
MQNERVIYELLAEVERERKRDQEDRKKKGEEVDEEAEAAEDFLGVKPLIEKLERRKAKEARVPDDAFWEPTDSDSDEDDERFSADSVRRRADEFDRKCKRQSELLRSFAEAGNNDSTSHFPSHFDHISLDLPNSMCDAAGQRTSTTLTS